MSEERSPKLLFDPELSRLVGRLNRMASEPTGRAAGASMVPTAVDLPSERPAAEPERGAPPAALADLLSEVAARGAADLFLVGGAPPVARIEGVLERLPGRALEGEALHELLLPLLGRRSRESLAARRFADFAFDVAGVGRFRANVHYERGRLAATLRALPATVPTLESLGMPAAVVRLADQRAGLVLVVGPAGAGKTTTLAALLARVLAARPLHAITIEEPVEYLHTHGPGLVEQVEIPGDCPSFAEALRSSLRQSPDVLLVGELRDPETMAAGLTAAETGHLVLASVHAHTAAQAIHRLVDAFPAAQQEQVRRQIAVTLSAVVAQRLLPRADGRGRVPAVEVLVATDAVRNLIREGRIHHLNQALSGARMDGMVTLEASLAELVRRGLVATTLARRHAYHPEELDRLLG